MTRMNVRDEEKAIWEVMARRGLMNIARARETSAIMVWHLVFLEDETHLDADTVLSFMQ